MSPENYRLLSLVARLPGKYYPEDRRPAEISADRQEYLVELGYLLQKTLVSAVSNEPRYPNGCVGYYLSPKAEDDLKLYEIEANRKTDQDVQDIQDRTAAAKGQLVNAVMSTLDLLGKK